MRFHLLPSFALLVGSARPDVRLAVTTATAEVADGTHGGEFPEALLEAASSRQECDWQCYLDRYPDLQSAFGPTNTAAAERHWNDHGQRENRDCACAPPGHDFLCDWQCYLDRYPDLQEAFGPNNVDRARLHWDQHGRREGRNCRCCAASGIGLRFQKFDTPGFTLPDRRGLYPVEQADAEAFAGTQAVSMRFFGDNMVTRNIPRGVKSWQQVERQFLEQNPAYLPTHPDDSSARAKATYWREMDEVVAAQLMRRQGLLTSAVFAPHPIFDKEQTMEEGADLVRADFPTDFPTLLVKRFLGQATLVDLGLVLDDRIFRQASCGRQDKPEFVNGGVALSGLIAWAITQVSPVAFASKWYNGRMRPEETAMMVTNGCLDSEVPAYIKAAIDGMNMQTAVDFTAYDEGSPVHPAYPAMHSAASSISTWLEIVSLLTPEQRAEAVLLDFSIAYYRTFAGVHWETDNKAGLQIGRAILLRALPGHLAKVYGCDRRSIRSIQRYVATKTRRVELNDWATWTPPGWTKPSLVFRR